MAKEVESLLVVICTIHFTCSISWNKLPTYIVLGESTSLKCIVRMDECPPPRLRLWMGGNTSLCKNDHCGNSAKYRMNGDSASPYSSELTIYNINVHDLSLEYSYFCGFSNYPTKLTVSKKNIISYPSHRTTEDNTTIVNGMLHVNFELDAVNPVPNCEVFFQNQTVKEQIPFNTEQGSYLQKAIYHDSLPLDHTCNGRLQIICKALSRRIKIIDRYLENCLSEHMAVKEEAPMYMVPLATTIAAISFISAAVGCVIYILRRNQRRDDYRDITNIQHV